MLILSTENGLNEQVTIHDSLPLLEDSVSTATPGNGVAQDYNCVSGATQVYSAGMMGDPTRVL